MHIKLRRTFAQPYLRWVELSQWIQRRSSRAQVFAFLERPQLLINRLYAGLDEQRSPQI